MHGGVGGRDCLSVALGDLFNRMSGTSWDAVSRTQLWNTKRPVWLQAIIHLVEPHVFPAVLELLDLLDSVISYSHDRSMKIRKISIYLFSYLNC